MSMIKKSSLKKALDYLRRKVPRGTCVRISCAFSIVIGPQ